MNAPLAVTVPPVATTTTSFAAPAVPAGVVAVILMAVLVNTVAVTPPTFRLLTPNKFVPAIVIVVPPSVGPLGGVTLAMVGSPIVLYVNAAAAVAEPLGVVTTTSFAPTVPEGVVAVSVVEFTTVKPVTAAPPMVTLLAPVKLVPTIVNEVPPPVGPEFGLTLAIVGA